MGAAAEFGPTLIEALVLGSGGLVSIGSILLTLIVLSSAGGLKKATAYFAGYTGAYLVIGLGAVLIGDRLRSAQPAGGEPSQTGSWISLVLGCVLVGFALKTWRSPDRDEGPPAFFASLDAMSAGRLFGFGVMIAAINFKNLAIFLSAVSVAVEARLSLGEASLVAASVAAEFGLAVLAPILLYAAGAERAAPLLSALRRGLETHKRRLTIGVLSLFGLLFAARGLSGLLG